MFPRHALSYDEVEGRVQQIGNHRLVVVLFFQIRLAMPIKRSGAIRYRQGHRLPKEATQGGGADMLKSFQHNPTLEAMLSFAGWQGGFSESDKRAMAESLNTIRTALVQPFGANSDAKRRDSKCVTDVEFDRAVMVVLSTALTMWLSGALDKTPCVGDAE